MQTLVVPAGQNRTAVTLNVFGDLISIKLAGVDTNGGCTVMEDVTQPQAGPPLHRHNREDETFYVLDGEYLFEVDGQQLKASTGATIFAPRGTAHRFQNVGSQPGRLLLIAQPAGLDPFFTELASATAGMQEPDMNVVIPIFEKHGLELLGPPLAARQA